MNKNKCYVLIGKYYDDNDSVLVFWSEHDAWKAMIEEKETEIINLQNSGYEFESVEDNIGVELYVPDSDIYFEWHIEESVIM